MPFSISRATPLPLANHARPVRPDRSRFSPGLLDSAIHYSPLAVHYVLCFDTLAYSFALPEKLTPAFSSSSTLFVQNTGGWHTPRVATARTPVAVAARGFARHSPPAIRHFFTRGGRRPRGRRKNYTKNYGKGELDSKKKKSR